MIKPITIIKMLKAALNANKAETHFFICESVFSLSSSKKTAIKVTIAKSGSIKKICSFASMINLCAQGREPAKIAGLTLDP